MTTKPHFRNPPVIEAWIEFQFTQDTELPSDNASSGDLEDVLHEYRQFMKIHYPDLDQKICLIDSDFTLQGHQVAPSPPRLNVARFQDTTETRCLQIGPKRIVVNQPRNDADWQGFEPLQSEATDFLLAYLDHWADRRLTGMAVHYRDVIHLPRPEVDGLQLQDYFTVFPKVPDSLGDYSHVAMALQLLGESAGPIRLEFNTLVNTTQERHYSFMLDWEVVPNPTFVYCEERDPVMAWLTEANLGLEGAFVNALTEKTKNDILGMEDS